MFTTDSNRFILIQLRSAIWTLLTIITNVVEFVFKFLVRFGAFAYCFVQNDRNYTIHWPFLDTGMVLYWKCYIIYRILVSNPRPASIEYCRYFQTLVLSIGIGPSLHKLKPKKSLEKIRKTLSKFVCVKYKSLLQNISVYCWISVMPIFQNCSYCACVLLG